MILSSSLLFPIAWFLSRWLKAHGEHGQSRSFVAYICWSNLYASITIGVAILASVLILCETIPVELCALVRPCFALESAMACRVFRVVFLGVMEDTQEDTSRSTTSNPHHCDVANYKRGRPPKF